MRGMPRRFPIRAALWAGLLAGLFAASSSPAFARDRLAVVMVAGDPALADNLVEVAISHLATRGDWELVGGRELRGRLAEILPRGGLDACAGERSCLNAVGEAAQAERVITGRIWRSGDTFAVDLSLTNTRTGEVEGQYSTATPADESGLIAAIRTGIDHLFAVKPAPPTLVVLSAAPAASPQPGRAPLLELRSENEPPAVRRGSILPYVGWGAGAVAVISFSAAAVTGFFSTATLTGKTRAEMQADLQRREEYATTANVLLGVGTTFTALAGVALYRWWRGERSAPRRSPLDAPGYAN